VEAGEVRLRSGGGELVQIDAAIIARVNARKNLKKLEISERRGQGKRGMKEVRDRRRRTGSGGMSE
jgi:hypothetical protein